MMRFRFFAQALSISVNVLFIIYLIYDLGVRRDRSEYPDQEPLPNSSSRNYAILTKHIKCFNKWRHYRITQRGNFIVLNNYIRSNVEFVCSQSITFTTHGDYTYLGNLLAIAEKWDGPVSVAIQAPATDFDATLESIAYLRRCGPEKIRDLFTFHIFFRRELFPSRIPKRVDDLKVNCKEPAPFDKPDRKGTHRSKLGIQYSVNVARNIARENAQTHYILASDIELYPTPNLIRKFLSMIDKPTAGKVTRKVYPMPVFEVKSEFNVPNTKTELVNLLRRGKAQVFHKTMCPTCHTIPGFDKWVREPEKDELNVFLVSKRHFPFAEWEPIYISDNTEPLFDERLSWEGKRDKMTQVYIMCVLDYEFHILDGAFVTHKPGYKKYQKNSPREYLVKKTYSKINNVLLPQITSLYGLRKECWV